MGIDNAHIYAAQTIARKLAATPALAPTKRVYHQWRYLSAREPGFRLALHPAVQLVTPAQWAGTSPQRGRYFFGYFDKSPWSPDTQRAIFHRWQGGAQVEIVIFDRQQQVARVVGQSAAWNWQQGSMTQWLPYSQGTRLIYNDVHNGHLVARIVGSEGTEEAMIPWPIQVVHPTGQEALSINYSRLDTTRPDYGYGVSAVNMPPDQPVAQEGIWHVDLASGKRRLLLSLADLLSHAPQDRMQGATHYVNHLLYSPDGARVVFMHRWMSGKIFTTRLYVMNADGSQLRLLRDTWVVSHYDWRDNTHVLFTGAPEGQKIGYYLIDTTTGEYSAYGESTLHAYGDGHPSFSHSGRWVVTDSYPDTRWQQQLVLYNTLRDTSVEVGRFLAPSFFMGPRRCDLHPRWSPDGRWLSIDSAHTGQRMTYILDVSSLVET